MNVLSSAMLYVAFMAPPTQKFVYSSVDVPLLSAKSAELSITPPLIVVYALKLPSAKPLYTPKNPPCSSMLMFLFSWVPPTYPV